MEFPPRWLRPAQLSALKAQAPPSTAALCLDLPTQTELVRVTRTKLNMDVYRAPNHNQMEYNFDNMEPKPGKMLPCQDDRFDSGLDSLKEDELANDIEYLSVDSVDDSPKDNEPWRSAVTEDGDT